MKQKYVQDPHMATAYSVGSTVIGYMYTTLPAIASFLNYKNWCDNSRCSVAL